MDEQKQISAYIKHIYSKKKSTFQIKHEIYNNNNNNNNNNNLLQLEYTKQDIINSYSIWI
jgi:hypothetical protein